MPHRLHFIPGTVTHSRQPLWTRHRKCLFLSSTHSLVARSWCAHYHFLLSLAFWALKYTVQNVKKKKTYLNANLCLCLAHIALKKKICIPHLLARRSTNGNVIVHYKLVWRSEQKRKRVIVLMTWSSLGLPPPFTHWVVNQLILIVLYSLHPRW